MNTTTLSGQRAEQRPDLIAARGTGVGIGLITFMLTWTIAARITEHIATAPNSAYIAMGIAITAGIATTIVAALRLTASITATGDHAGASHASRAERAS